MVIRNKSTLKGHNLPGLTTNYNPSPSYATIYQGWGEENNKIALAILASQAHIPVIERGSPNDPALERSKLGNAPTCKKWCKKDLTGVVAALC